MWSLCRDAEISATALISADNAQSVTEIAKMQRKP